ncbi:MAG TPA: tol-pal system protein YbgF [Candidatus Krumholzibacteria bacterium]|nr:tol-pal system protein YbgF [Candidatus Krumholzibacteria bacterium]
MRRILGSVLLVAVLTGSSGCAKQLQRIETRTDEIATIQARLAAEQRELASIVERLDERDAEREAELVERRAELEYQLRALDRVVRQLDARAQEQQELLQRISAALDLLTRRTPSGPDAPTATAPTDSTIAAASGGDPLESPGQDVFDAAFDDYTGGRYALAREGFQEVLDRFEDSELADDARYWVAETHYAEGDHATARDGFAEVVERWSESDVVPPALLKLAYSMLELGESEDAIATLQRLVDEHPDSDEALIAEHRLSTLSAEE